MKLNKNKILYFIALFLLSYVNIFGAIGQSAIITLSFPFGARTTGLGETFTGIANSVDATFYNPAGLGQDPLANTWKIHTPVEGIDYNTIASKSKRAFGKKEKIWAGSTNNGLLLYNGRAWTSYEGYLIEEDDNLRNIAEKILNTDNDDLIVEAINIIKKENRIEQKWYDKTAALISPILIDSLKNDHRALDYIISSIINLNESQRNATQIFGLIASKVDTAFVDSISNELEKVFQINDRRLSDLVELKIPFRIAIKDSINVLALDASDRLWVGTNRGLWRYDGSTWNSYSILDGLPSNRIIAIATGTHQKIAVATDKGVSIYSQGRWVSFTTDAGLPSQGITSLTFAENNILYVGTKIGLFRKDSTNWQFIDSTMGLLSSEVSALMFDSENNLWVGCKGGIAVYNKVTWKRYKFPGSKINCFSEFKPGKVWIGTNKGAISYQAGKIRKRKSGNSIQEPPRWKPFHSKNVLEGNDVRGISVHGKDIWLVTEKAINQYDRGDMQLSFFGEPLLPAFDIPDLWHTNIGGTFPTEEWGTIGFYLNYLSFGQNEQYNAQGKKIKDFQSYEFVLSLCYGLQLKENFSFGLNLKYAHSALAPGIDDDDPSSGVGQTFAVDASILRKNLFIKNLSLGFTIMNMGPAVYYIQQENKDPIPFTLRLGLAYTILQTPVHNLLIALDLDREIVYKEDYKEPSPFYKAIFQGLNDERWKRELKEVIVHFGIEYWYVYFLAFRMGVMIDEIGVRKELSLGLGLRYGNWNVDWSYIHSPNKSIARDGQWRLSLTFSQ